MSLGGSSLLRGTRHPPVLKNTSGILIVYQSFLLYLILQPLVIGASRRLRTLCYALQQPAVFQFYECCLILRLPLRKYYDLRMGVHGPPAEVVELVKGDSVRNAEPSGTKGSERSRIPVAAKIAFPTAGASPTIGVSPAPADGKSLRSSMSISITGVSLNRGTRYPARCGLSMRPFLK